jgi:hypothetical protein
MIPKFIERECLHFSQRHGCKRCHLQKTTNGIKQQSEKLRQQYADMAAQFLEKGLDTEFIASLRDQFKGLETKGVPASPGKAVAPRLYAEDFVGGPFPDNAIRLAVLPLEPATTLSSAGAHMKLQLLQSRAAGYVPSEICNMRLHTRAGESITREVLKHFSFVKDVFRNTRDAYHLTLFHTSKTEYPCPDPTLKSGGVDPDMPANERPDATKARFPTLTCRKIVLLTFAC